MVSSSAATDGRMVQVTIVVLGEIGQSPRMLNHARVLLELGARLDLISYAGEVTPEWLRDHPLLRLHALGRSGNARRHRLAKVWFLVHSLGRLLSQSAGLGVLLTAKVRRPDVILIQVPPSIPTCAIATLAARLRRAKLIVDWHNYGYTMLALRLGPRHAVVRLAKAYERGLARFATHHLCVSQAMGRDLKSAWGLNAPSTLYDRPRAVSPPLSDQDRRAFFERLPIALPETTRAALVDARPERPAVLVSPTSWTLDEDFTTLVEALPPFDRTLAQNAPDGGTDAQPRAIVVITGRGPRRAYWEAAFEGLALKHVLIRTGWLSAGDFRALLRLADLGLCFHTSSSGLDLPMKNVDMIAANLPICAYDYGPCLAEQVRTGENGLLFKDGAQLAEQLTLLLGRFPEPGGQLDNMRRTARWSGPLWREEWLRVAGPAFGLGANAEANLQVAGDPP